MFDYLFWKRSALTSREDKEYMRLFQQKEIPEKTIFLHNVT